MVAIWCTCGTFNGRCVVGPVILCQLMSFCLPNRPRASYSVPRSKYERVLRAPIGSLPRQKPHQHLRQWQRQTWFLFNEGSEDWVRYSSPRV